MVTFYVVSEYIPTKRIEGGGKKILGGPLYDLARIKAITQGGKGLQLWTSTSPQKYRHMKTRLHAHTVIANPRHSRAMSAVCA